MRALSLTTRFRDGAFEGDACLLVYDTAALPEFVIGDDVREVLDRKPNTPRIYVLAPFLPLSTVEEALKSGVAIKRAGAVPTAGELSALGLQIGSDGLPAVVSQAFTLRGAKIQQEEKKPLPTELREGWLFDLFDTHRGRVDAPLGIHFGKASEKHSDKFLRTSNVLLSTVACAVVGFFAVAAIRARAPRRIFVDTAPLLSVAFSMQRVASVLNLWDHMPPAKSFSSYGGIDKLPSLSRDDLVLISASTSGGLAKRLVGVGVEPAAAVTLFVLKSSATTTSPGPVLCDLTYSPGRTFGYPMVENYAAADCELCRRGFVLAELEGDQFLLERRGVKRLRIVSETQTKDARKAAELLARRRLVKVHLYQVNGRRTDISIDVQGLFDQKTGVAQDYLRLLRRFTPVPLDLVVLVGFEKTSFDAVASSAGLDVLYQSAKVVPSDLLGEIDAIDGGNALVIVDFLSDHAQLRGINAQLRTKVPRGCVAYLPAVTVAESAQNLADLRIFLSYGERGPNTFTYCSAMELMLPWSAERPSSWEQELQLLRKLDLEADLPAALADRKRWLESSADAVDGIFLPGQQGNPTKIAADFVFLDTNEDIEKISQADVYAIVSNLLAASRCDNNGLQQVLRKDSPPLRWDQTVYGQVLLCPANFRYFNDAVLRASFLRAANLPELNYAVDRQCSREMLDVLMADLASWNQGRADALPEFLLSLACGRLRLMRNHLDTFAEAIKVSDVPEHMKLLARAIARD